MTQDQSLCHSDLYSGEKISRSSPRIDTLGDIDELNSVLGIARYHCPRKENKEEIHALQKMLITVSSELATNEKNLKTTPLHVDKAMLAAFIEKVEALQQGASAPEDFVIPGDCLAAAHLHHARTIARRCERKVTALFEHNEITNTNILKWFNRVGAYLFYMALGSLNEENN